MPIKRLLGQNNNSQQSSASSEKPPLTIGTSTSQTLPWMESAFKDITGRANAYAKLPYQAFPQRRLVNQATNPLWQQYYQRSQQMGVPQPYFNQAQNYIQQGTQSFPQNAQAYMNPYMQHVIENIGHYGTRNFQEKILPSLESHFVSMGQHGSGRHQQMAERAARDLSEGIAREQAGALAGGYNAAGQLFNEDQKRKFFAAEGQSQLGRMAQGSHLADIAALQEAAANQTGHEQRGLNMSYEDFMRQKNDPMEKINFERSVLQGIPHMGSTTNTSYTPPPPEMNTWGNIGSLAGNLYAARSMYNKKKGGAVRKQKNNHFGLKNLTSVNRRR